MNLLRTAHEIIRELQLAAHEPTYVCTSQTVYSTENFVYFRVRMYLT